MTICIVDTVHRSSVQILLSPMLRCRIWHSHRTKFNADSVEFKPIEEKDGDTRSFVCGNYQLNEETREKVGRIYLYQLQTNQLNNADVASASASAAAASSQASAASFSTVGLLEQQVLETAAIFDLKWSPRLLADKRLLGQVDASGALLLYQFNHGTPQADGDASRSSLSLMHSQQVVEGASCLSLDWSNRKEEQSVKHSQRPASYERDLLTYYVFCPLCNRAEPQIAISQSNSQLSLWQLTPAGPIASHRWLAHEYEIWIVSFDTHRRDVLYSGADDCKLKGWDVRASPTMRSALFVDTSHSMGVCSIQSHPFREHLLATGSYDESLRLWDVRQMRQPVLVTEHALGGGVWRVRWNPDPARADEILCCAMHNGFAVVDVELESDVAAAAADGAAASFTHVSTATCVQYKHHSSLAYGADWCAQPASWLPKSSIASDVCADVIATCSFYDKQLDVWSINARTLKEAETTAKSEVVATASVSSA
jgi:diphthamide biosynthesis protein 7